jgi:hypothetical protein
MVNGKKPMAYLVDKRIYLPSGMKIVSDGLDSDQLSIGPNQVGSNEHHYLSLDLIWPFFYVTPIEGPCNFFFWKAC